MAAARAVHQPNDQLLRCLNKTDRDLRSPGLPGNALTIVAYSLIKSRMNQRLLAAIGDGSHSVLELFQAGRFGWFGKSFTYPLFEP